MKHAGMATRAALRLIYWSLVVVLILMLAGVLARWLGGFIVAMGSGLVGVWVVFGLFCLYFFRDPSPHVPRGPDLIVSPASGTVDLIDETDEPEFMGGRCRRVSIFLSVFDVHVQRAPVAGRIAFSKYTPGAFNNALRTDCGVHNENILIGFESGERAGERVAVRLIAGLIARRIVPWCRVGDQVERGERLSLIQFGSRVELFLPLSARVEVGLRTKVKVGETVIARRG